MVCETEKPVKINLNANDKIIAMDCDTGIPISAISERFYINSFKEIALNACNVKSGSMMEALGSIFMTITYKSISKQLFVMKNGGPPILDREWLNKLNIIVDKLLRLNK